MVIERHSISTRHSVQSFQPAKCGMLSQPTLNQLLMVQPLGMG